MRLHHGPGRMAAGQHGGLEAERSHLTNKHEAVKVEGAGLKFSKSIWHDVLPPAKLHLPKLPKPTNQGPRVQRPPPMGDIPYSKH